MDDKAFRRDLKRYQQLTGKTFPDIVNKKIYFLLLKARKKVRTASEHDIERVYGPKFSFSKKTGKLARKLRTPRGRGDAVKIWLSFNRDKVGGMDRQEMLTEVKKFVGGRYRARSYTVAGFNEPIRKFGRAARIKNKISRGPRRKSQRGGGFPAKVKGRASQRLSAYADYTLGQSWGSGKGKVPRQVEIAVRREVAAEKQSTRDYIARKELDIMQRKAGL